MSLPGPISVVDGMAMATRWGVRAALAAPKFVCDQARVMLEPFDLRNPDRVGGRPGLRLAVEAMADEALMTAFRLNVIDQPPHIVEEIAAEVAQATELFESSGWFDDPASYFQTPPALVDPVLDTDQVARLEIERLSFESGYMPHPDEPGIERWDSYDHNHVAHAWVVRHLDRPRPWLILQHGASMGWSLADLAVFRAAWLHHELQLNLVFPVMPFHGPRARRTPLSLQLPVEDPIDTIHALSQAVWDVRRLISWIRAQSDEPIALHGISLGTYPSALVASLEPGMTSLTAGVPASSLSDLYVQHMPARLRRRPDIVHFVEEAKQLLQVVSPLGHTPMIPRDRRFIYAARSDRVTDPIAQVQRLWNHWERPEILWFEGSHLGVAVNKAVPNFLRHTMELSGLLEDAA